MNLPLMRSCREVTRMVSQGEDRDLGLVERAELRLHLAICRGCRNASMQLRFLRRVVRSLPDETPP